MYLKQTGLNYDITCNYRGNKVLNDVSSDADGDTINKLLLAVSTSSQWHSRLMIVICIYWSIMYTV